MFWSRDDGQYMVEFALTFSVFVFFMLFVIDIGLMIYNHNLFYNAVYRGARQASLGASNDEINEAVFDYGAQNYLPTLFMMAHPEENLTIRPNQELERVQGESVTVSMRTTFGITVFGLLTLTTTVPISSKELVTVQNDDDRDGLKDSLEANPEDHDNDGVTDAYMFDGPDMHADNDSEAVTTETVTIGYFDGISFGCPGWGTCVGGHSFTGYAISRPNPAGAGCNVFVWPVGSGEVWQKSPCFDGNYHAPEIWDNDQRAPAQLFSRSLPNWHVDNSGDTVFLRTLRTSRDSDNDGWIDKYDEDDDDPTVH